MASNLLKKDEQIMLLETKLDDLEQYTRKFNLESCEIPEDEDEDLETIGMPKCRLESQRHSTLRTDSKKVIWRQNP